MSVTERQKAGAMPVFLLRHHLTPPRYVSTLNLNRQRGGAMKDERIGRNIRLNQSEWEDFKRLLGASWLRGQIAKALKREQRNIGQRNVL